MKIVRLPVTGILLLAFLLTQQACSEDPVEEGPAIPFQKTVNSHSSLALYTPPEFDVNPVFQDGVSGFSIEQADREFIGAVVRTTSSNLSLSTQSGQDVTAPAFAQAALDQLLHKVRNYIPNVLGSGAKEGEAWRITTLQKGLTDNRTGQPVAFGHFALQYAPAYQLRSSTMALMIGYELVGVQWPSFPRNRDAYYHAGNNIIEFVLAIALLDLEEFYGTTSSQGQSHVDFAYAALPRTKSSRDIMDTIADTLSFKTMGSTRDEFGDHATSFTVSADGPAIDIILAVDEADSMYGEGNVLAEQLPLILSRLRAETDLDYRLGVITNVSDQLIPFADGRSYLSRDSSTPEDQLADVLSTIWTASSDVDSYRPRNELLRQSASWISSTDGTMRRPDAPAILLTLSDRDDASRDLDGNSFSSISRRAEYYAEHLRPYGEWIAVFANHANCWTLDRDQSAEAGNIFARASRVYGGTSFNLCRDLPGRYIDALFEAVTRHGARFQFDVPQPLPFTLSVKLNGTLLPKSRGIGWYYHVLDDRIVLSSSLGIQEDDVIEAEYKLLTPTN